jgi:hypothetical protein
VADTPRGDDADDTQHLNTVRIKRLRNRLIKVVNKDLQCDHTTLAEAANAVWQVAQGTMITMVDHSPTPALLASNRQHVLQALVDLQHRIDPPPEKAN